MFPLLFTFYFLFFFFNDTATTEIYTLSLHDALPISAYNTTWSQDTIYTQGTNISFSGTQINWDGSWAESVFAKIIQLTSYVKWSNLWNQVYNETEIDAFTLSHWTDDLGNRGYTSLSNFTDNVFGNSTIARIGDCPEGQFVQNTTTGGNECTAPAGGGDITAVYTTLDNYLYNGSASGDIYLRFNDTLMYNAIGNYYDQSLNTTDNITFNKLSLTNNLDISATGSSTSNPRTGAFSNLASGNAVRFMFGDEHNAFQNAYGNDLQIYSYWGVQLIGGMQNYNSGFLPPGFTKTIDAGVLIKSLNDIGDDGGSPADPIVTLVVMGPPDVTGNLTEWRDNNSNILASLGPTGNITAPYFIGDGSQLTNLPAGSESDPIWSSNYTAYNDSWSLDTNTWDTSWFNNWSAYNTTWSTDTTYSDLSEFNDDILWTSIFNSTGDTRWTTETYVNLQNTSMKNYVDSNPWSFITSSALSPYVQWITLWNQVYNETEVDAINISMKNYVDSNPGNYITSLLSDTSPQLGGNLDANTYDIQLDSNNKLCLDGATCSHYIYYNGTATIIS